jgi:hypothetical protein
MLPGVEAGPDPTVFHRVDHRIERAAASTLLAFVWTCQCTIFFAKQYLPALMAALDRSDDRFTFHLKAPSLLSYVLVRAGIMDPALRLTS